MENALLWIDRVCGRGSVTQSPFTFYVAIRKFTYLSDHFRKAARSIKTLRLKIVLKS